VHCDGTPILSLYNTHTAKLAGEALVTVFVVKGIIGYMLDLFALMCITATGPKNAFDQMVAIQYFMLLFVILFLHFRKKIRAATTRFGPMAKISNRD
jgi:hypothetical protein